MLNPFLDYPFISFVQLLAPFQRLFRVRLVASLGRRREGISNRIMSSFFLMFGGGVNT